MKTFMRRTAFVLTLFACTGSALHAQGLGARLKAKAKEKLAAKVDTAASTATDSLINRGVRVVKCAVKDVSCQKKASDAGTTVVLTDAKGQTLPAAQQPTAEAKAVVNGTAPNATSSAPASSGASGAAASAPDAPVAGSAAAPPGQGLWLNYDFIPGDRTIWVEDFANDEVGDFPRRMELKEGNFEVVKYQGKKYLRSQDGGTVIITLPEVLPSRFTFEVHLVQPHIGNPLKITTTDESAAMWHCSSTEGGVYGGFEKAQSAMDYPNEAMNPVDCRFTVDSRYIKAYVNDMRVANVPTTDVKLTNKLYLEIPGGWDKDTPVLITDIRVAAGGKKLYDALAANGRVATQGILFDTNSDVIRPESTPTLKEITDMLTEHPDLKLMIEGHTDNVGAPAANLDLSTRRAAAVRTYLTSHGIDAARLQSKGLGATKPAAPNTTAEGRQQNRRVELVRIP